jgi:hypothetical protein
MFWTLIGISAVILAIGWAAYGIWEYRLRQEEKSRPREVSEKLKKSRQAFEEYLKKMESFKKPERKPEQEKRETNL